MTKRIEATCPNCEKPFSYYPSGYKDGIKIHCSRKCQSEASRVTTICPECDKEFWYHQSWPRKYCSLKCSAANNAKANLGIIDLPPMFCDFCGKEITKNKWVGRRFCSQKCFGEYLSKTQKGVPRPIVRGEKPHLWKRIIKTCLQCNKQFQVKQSHAERRKFCKKSCQVEWQRLNNALVSGENNFNWQGGYNPYYGPNWRQQRRNARYRDNYTCQRCHITEKEYGHQLDVHHIKPFREFGIEHYKEANHLGNLICYCNTCHLITEHAICSL